MISIEVEMEQPSNCASCTVNHPFIKMLGKKAHHGYNRVKAVFNHGGGGKKEDVPMSEENRKRKALMDELCEEVHKVEAEQAGDDKSRWHRKDLSLIIGWLEKLGQLAEKKHILSPAVPVR
jgi:hypothetical protein